MVIIFGGAFNPPTIAHQEIYFHIQKTVPFSQFIYLPVSNLYTKRSLSSNFHRLQMLTILIKDLPLASVSSLEFDDSDYLGTYQSLLRHQEKYPLEELAFVIGADNLHKLHKWINAKSLLSEFKFIVLNRTNMNIEDTLEKDLFLKDYLHQFIILPNFDVDISSTKFRETFDPEFVTKEIYDYIVQNELYRG